MNIEVNFEIAKLLKEKDYNEVMREHYTMDKLVISDVVSKYNWNRFTDMAGNDYYYSAPTIAQVIMWLYEKYGIWISVYTMDKWLPNGNDREQLFDYSLKQMKLGLIDIPKKPEEFSSPTEAYLKAITHVLTNLI